MSCLNIARIACQIFGIVALIGAVGLTAAGFFTAEWQTVKFSENGQIQEHHHGLIWDCLRSTQSLTGSKDFICNFKSYGVAVLKVDEDSRNPHVHLDHHDGENWRLAVLALVAAGMILGVVALSCSFCGSCLFGCSVSWTISTILAAICVVAGVVVFKVNSLITGNRFLTGIYSVQEQVVGWSFAITAAGAVLFILAAILSIATTILIRLVSSQEGFTQKTYSSHNGKSTVI